MTIITLKQQLSQMFNPDFVLRIAKQVGFTQRERAIQPLSLVLSLIAALSKGNCHAIADLHRQFNGMCLSEKDYVAYKPFHNQLRKPEFAELMQQITQVAMLRFAEQTSRNLPDKLACFDDVLLQDGSSFRVHDELADVFPSRFKRTPAAIECHLTMSLNEHSPKAMTITADTASERTYLPEPATLKNKLLLADAGYIDFSYFDAVEKHNGTWIVRGLQSLNPTIIEATNGQGRPLPKLAGKKLKEVNRRTSRAEVLDLKVRRGKQVFRVVRRWFKEEKRFCLWVTNLPDDKYTADDIMSVYRCRWQVELLFKELKSNTNWRRFATRQKAIVEGVVWASLLTLIIRRFIALKIPGNISVSKAAKNVDVWLLPILTAYIHQAWSEITACLEWAVKYISGNALKSPQRKPRQDKTLDGIFEKLNS